ncbi:unnamed protein product [Symbiodinium sp. CCMP2592]|nr:unnamed protein product [Symbiodinium sp. CCMP2592]
MLGTLGTPAKMEKDYTAAEAVRTALHQDLVFDAMAEVHVDGAISLRGLRLALERRTGIYLTPYKDVIRRVAELCVHNGGLSGYCQDRRCHGPTCGNTHCARHSEPVLAAACKQEAVEMISTTPMGSASGRGSSMFTQLADELGFAKVWVGTWETLPGRLFWEKGDLQAKGRRLTQDVCKKRNISGTTPFRSSAMALQELAVRIRARAAKHVLESHNMRQTDCQAAVAVKELGAMSNGGFEDKDDRHKAGRRLAEVLGMTCMFAGRRFERHSCTARSLTFDPGGWVSRSESELYLLQPLV